MIAYTLKNVLELVPAALPFVKEASLEQEYPLANKHDCMASALCVSYHEHIDHKSVDPWVMEKIASAIDTYGIRTEYQTFVADLKRGQTMTKQAAAEDKQAEFMAKQAAFEGDRSGFVDVEQLAKQASDLYEEAQRYGITPVESILVYSGNAYLSKQAAVGALTARFQLTKDPVFVKIAVAISDEDNFNPSRKTIQDLCQTVSGLDKKAGISARGFDFYREALIVKEAAFSKSVRVRVGKEEFPLETVMRIPSHHLENYLGKDVAKELRADPANAKAVIESLPADLQQILVTLIKHA